MPRIARGKTTGGSYHVVNRGNMRIQVFDDVENYNYFLELLKAGTKKEAVELHAYYLLPDTQPFSSSAVPQKEGSLSRLIPWMMASHVRH